MRASFPVFFLGEEMTRGLVFSGDNTRGQCLRDASCFILNCNMENGMSVLYYFPQLFILKNVTNCGKNNKDDSLKVFLSFLDLVICPNLKEFCIIIAVFPGVLNPDSSYPKQSDQMILTS